MTEKDKIRLEIVTPLDTVVSANVEWVKLPGVSGPFEVLLNHAPLVTKLVRGNISYRKGDKDAVQPVKSGFVEVFHNKVSACVEI